MLHQSSLAQSFGRVAASQPAGAMASSSAANAGRVKVRGTCTCNQPARPPASPPASQPDSQPTSQPASQSASQSASQPVSQI